MEQEYVHDPGRSLTKEEIEEIKHTITHIDLVKPAERPFFTKVGFSEVEAARHKRYEDVNKLR